MTREEVLLLPIITENPVNTPPSPSFSSSSLSSSFGLEGEEFSHHTHIRHRSPSPRTHNQKERKKLSQIGPFHTYFCI